MNVPQEELDGFARAFFRIHSTNARAARAIRQGDPHTAEKAIEDARALAHRSLMAAIRAGAVPPVELPPRPDVPLAMMDTPANRRLLRALRETVEAAIERDKETGDYPDGLADGFAHFAAGVAEEVEGPMGAGRE